MQKGTSTLSLVSLTADRSNRDSCLSMIEEKNPKFMQPPDDFNRRLCSAMHLGMFDLSNLFLDIATTYTALSQHSASAMASLIRVLFLVLVQICDACEELDPTDIQQPFKTVIEEAVRGGSFDDVFAEFDLFPAANVETFKAIFQQLFRLCYQQKINVSKLDDFLGQQAAKTNLRATMKLTQWYFDHALRHKSPTVMCEQFDGLSVTEEAKPIDPHLLALDKTRVKAFLKSELHQASIVMFDAAIVRELSKTRLSKICPKTLEGSLVVTKCASFFDDDFNAGLDDFMSLLLRSLHEYLKAADGVALIKSIQHTLQFTLQYLRLTEMKTGFECFAAVKSYFALAKEARTEYTKNPQSHDAISALMKKRSELRLDELHAALLYQAAVFQSVHLCLTGSFVPVQLFHLSLPGDLYKGERAPKIAPVALQETSFA